MQLSCLYINNTVNDPGCADQKARRVPVWSGSVPSSHASQPKKDTPHLHKTWSLREERSFEKVSYLPGVHIVEWCIPY